MKRTRSRTALHTTLSAREAEAEVRRLLAEYTPEIARRMVAARRKLRSRIPRGFELIYDTYNGLGIGYGAAQKFSAPVVSLVAYPRWVTLFFLHGAQLDDPHELLQGQGSRVRSIRLASADMLDDPQRANRLATTSAARLSDLTLASVATRFARLYASLVAEAHASS